MTNFPIDPQFQAGWTAAIDAVRATVEAFLHGECAGGDRRIMQAIEDAGCLGNLTSIPLHAYTLYGRRFQLAYIIVCEKCGKVIRGINTCDEQEVAS